MAAVRRRYRPWTAAALATLRALYADTPTAHLARRLRRPIGTVYAKAAKLGLKKSAAYLATAWSGRLTQGGAERGGSTRFQPGHTTWNKGLKGLQIGGQATQFKPGSRPHTWKPIGSERTVDGYLQRKVTDTGYPPRDWQPVHVLLWTSHHGPVPAGHAVRFKDGDRTHIALDNLELISRAALMARNTLHNLPPELIETIRARSALVRRINHLTAPEATP